MTANCFFHDLYSSTSFYALPRTEDAATGRSFTRRLRSLEGALRTNYALLWRASAGPQPLGAEAFVKAASCLAKVLSIRRQPDPATAWLPPDHQPEFPSAVASSAGGINLSSSLTLCLRFFVLIGIEDFIAAGSGTETGGTAFRFLPILLPAKRGQIEEIVRSTD
jgi:hypothetical protein